RGPKTPPVESYPKVDGLGRSLADLDRCVRAQDAVADRVLGHDHPALTAHVVASVHREVEQLHGADGRLVHDKGHGVREVARVAVGRTSLNAGGDVRARQVVRLDDLDARNAEHLTVRVRTLTTEVAVDGLLRLHQLVVLSRTDEAVAVALRYVLLVQLLRGHEERSCEVVAAVLEVCVSRSARAALIDDRTTRQARD